MKTKAPPDRPLIRRLMSLVDQIIQDSAGDLSKASVAKELGIARTKLSQWIGGEKSAPEGEKTMRLIAWGNKNSKKFLQDLFGANY